MTTLGFENYLDPLKLYLSKYRETVKGEKPEKKVSVRVKSEKDTSNPSSFHSGANIISPLHNAHFIQYNHIQNSSSSGVPGRMNHPHIMQSSDDSSSGNPFCSASPSVFMNAFSPVGKF